MLILKNKLNKSTIATATSIMLAKQKFRRKGKDFIAKIIINRIINQLHTDTFIAITNKTKATNKSKTPSILTSINLKSKTCFKTL
ncbi:MAG: hypothetical protein K6T16_00550 [Candidatus Pacearchaeota archaeon]|nr:hypothetical protein [Candidatus Pacearchaeota archaeon]